MKYLAWLDETLGAKLRAGAIGKPVFVRANLQLVTDHGHLISLASSAVESAAKWIGSPVRSVYAQGGARQGFVSLLVEFAAGQSALLAAETAHGNPPELQLLVVGQHGTLRFDDYPEPLQLGPTAPARVTRWANLIEASLQSGEAAAAKE